MEARVSFLQQTWQKTATYDNEDYGYALTGFAYKSFTIASYALCWFECEKDEPRVVINNKFFEVLYPVLVR